jgi:hypothetical protein
MTHGRLGPPLTLCQIDDEYIYNCHIQEEEENPVPPLIGAVLHTVQCSQLIHHVRTTHMCGILKVHGKSHNILTHHTVLSRNCVYQHTRKINGKCMCGKKYNGLFIFPYNRGYLTELVHPSFQSALGCIFQSGCVFAY